MSIETPRADKSGARTQFTQMHRFQIDLLAALATIGPCKGLAIRDRLGERYDEEVNHGRLYPNLDQLEAAGLIEIERQAIDDRTNRYSLTTQGRVLLDERREWLEGER
jgi:DNA-binding PadR family transcriptional regulator